MTNNPDLAGETLQRRLQLRGERVIGCYPILNKITKCSDSSFVLSQLLYWQLKMVGEEFYKTDAELMRETCLSKRKFMAAKLNLKRLNVVKITLKGCPAKTYYQINNAHINALLDKYDNNKLKNI